MSCKFSLSRANTQLQSSQISRFFSHSQPNEETQNAITFQTIHRKPIENDNQNEAVIGSKSINNDNESMRSLDNQCEVEIPKQIGENKKKHSHNSKMIDTKSTIKSFFSNGINDSLSDFEIPNKVAKKVPKPLPSKTVKSSRSRRKQPDIRKALNKKETTSEDYSHLPENAQVEIALAMSMAETIANASDVSNEPFDFDKYKFKPLNPNTNANFLNLFNRKQKGKGRYKWNSKCTQLTRRQEHVQKSKARKKIDDILLNNIIVESNPICDQLLANALTNYTPMEIHSRRLQRICVSERILFELNSCEIHSNANGQSYYTNNLVEPSKHRAGILLRDWSRIPGRDAIYDNSTQSTNDINDDNDDVNVNVTNDKTDATVIPTSPVYESQIDDNESEHDMNPDDIDSTKNDSNNEMANINQRQQTSNSVDTINNRVRSPAQQTSSSVDTIENRVCSPMDYENDAITDAGNLDDDVDATLLIDSDDIQSKVDTINSKIRLSQNFSDIFQTPILTFDAIATTRTISPDLFDDDDDNDIDMNIRKECLISLGFRKERKLFDKFYWLEQKFWSEGYKC